MREDSNYPSLHFKKLKGQLWSVRVTDDYRALALARDYGFLWFWIGNHTKYEKLIR